MILTFKKNKHLNLLLSRVLKTNPNKCGSRAQYPWTMACFTASLCLIICCYYYGWTPAVQLRSGTRSSLSQDPFSCLGAEWKTVPLIKSPHFIFRPVITDLILPNNCFMAITCIFTRSLMVCVCVCWMLRTVEIILPDQALSSASLSFVPWPRCHIKAAAASLSAGDMNTFIDVGSGCAVQGARACRYVCEVWHQTRLTQQLHILVLHSEKKKKSTNCRFRVLMLWGFLQHIHTCMCVCVCLPVRQQRICSSVSLAVSQACVQYLRAFVWARVPVCVHVHVIYCLSRQPGRCEVCWDQRQPAPLLI